MSKPAGERLAAIEAILTRVENKVDRQEQRISNIEVTVTSFKGGWWALGTAGTLVSAITAWVVSASDWFKGS